MSCQTSQNYTSSLCAFLKIKASHTRGVMLQGLGAATYCNQEITCCSHKGTSHPGNILFPQHVPWSSTRWTLATFHRDKIAEIFMVHKLKIIRIHKEGHVAETCNSHIPLHVYAMGLCHCCMSQLQVPATCHLVWTTQLHDSMTKANHFKQHQNQLHTIC